MRLRLNGRELVVFWKHEKSEAPLWDRVTTCYVGEPSENRGRDPRIISVASACCSRKDQYSYDKGRRISMARAIAGYERTERQQFWLAYFRQTGGNKYAAAADTLMSQISMEDGVK